MNDLLLLGTAGLRVHRAALDVVGGNVANAATEGYTRRRADVRPLAEGSSAHLHYSSPAPSTGAVVKGVARNYDMFLAAEVRSTAAAAGRDEAAARWMAEIETSLGSRGTGIAGGLDRFYAAANDVAASPLSLPARAVFLQTAETLAGSFRETGDALADMQRGIAAEMDRAASAANRALGALANINLEILRARPGTGGEAALLDERDRQLAALSEIVPITVEQAEFGRISVRLDGPAGEPLLTAENLYAIGIRPDESGASQLLVDAEFAPRPVALPSAGSLAGLRESWAAATAGLNEIDALANRFSARMNEEHARHVDLAGTRGGPLFRADGAITAASAFNRGAAAVAAETDGTALVPGGYRLNYDGAAESWTLARLDGTGAVSGTGELTLDGLTVKLGGDPANGDGFTIEPASGARFLRAALDNPAALASAKPYQMEVSEGFGGAVKLGLDDSAALPGPAPHSFGWTDAGTIEIVDADGSLLGASPYASGAPVAGNGYSLTVTGSPAPGDRVNVRATPAQWEDNSGILSLISLGDRTSEAFEESFTLTHTRLSAAVAESERRREISGAAAQEAERAMTNATGVNLDEEAADLLRFQQGYEAATRIIAAAREMFDALLRIA